MCVLVYEDVIFLSALHLANVIETQLKTFFLTLHIEIRAVI